MNRKRITSACGLSALAMFSAYSATTSANDEHTMYLLFALKSSSTSESPSNFVSFDPETKVFAVGDVIQRTEAALGLSRQHIAKIFKSSRQNIYNLLNNLEQKPNPETEKRARQVNEALDAIREIYPYKLGASVLTVRIEEKRLFDVLTEDRIDIDEVKRFTETIAKRIGKQTQLILPESVVEQQEFLNRPNAI